jgi:FkbM family methyltransferase
MSSFPISKASIAKMVCSPMFSSIILTVFKDKIPNIRKFGREPFRFNLKSPYIQGRRLAEVFWGIHENEEISFIQKYLKKDADTIELGSSIGVLSTHIRYQVAADKKFISVEANPHLIKTIENNLKANSFGKPYVVKNYALSYAAPTVEFAVNADTGVSRIFSSTSTRKNVVEVVKVKAVKLSELLIEFNISEFVMVSDIEGAEIDYIMNDVPVFNKCKQLIAELHDTEYGGKKYSVNDLKNLIVSRLGFTYINHLDDVYIFNK